MPFRSREQRAIYDRLRKQRKRAEKAAAKPNVPALIEPARPPTEPEYLSAQKALETLNEQIEALKLAIEIPQDRRAATIATMLNSARALWEMIARFELEKQKLSTVSTDPRTAAQRTLDEKLRRMTHEEIKAEIARIEKIEKLRKRKWGEPAAEQPTEAVDDTLLLDAPPQRKLLGGPDRLAG